MTHHRRIVPTLLSGVVIGACASSALIAQNSLVFVPVRADVVMSADMQKQIGVDRLTPAQRFALDTWLTRYTAEIRADEAAAVRGDDASEPAPAAVRQGVIERPVTVNEAEADTAVIATEHSVSAVQALDEAGEAIDKRPLTVGVMVQMHFDIRDAHADESREPIDRRGVVLIFRVEERVARRPTSGVGMAARESRPARRPPLDPFQRGPRVRAAPPWLEMIGNGDPDSLDGRRATVCHLTQPCGRVSGRPDRQRARVFESLGDHSVSATRVAMPAATR